LPELEPDLVSYRGRDKATAELAQPRHRPPDLGERKGESALQSRGAVLMIRRSNSSIRALSAVARVRRLAGALFRGESSMPIRAGLLTLKMTPTFIRAHGSGLRA